MARLRRRTHGNTWEGRPGSLDDLLVQHFPEIYGYLARRIGGQAAEDVAAETFAVALAQRDRYDAARGSERAWLYGIATNLLGRHRRDEARWLARRARYPQADPPWEEDAVARLDSDREWTRVADALQRIDPAQRDVLFLTAVSGLSLEETASALGLAIGTVKSRANRGRVRLRSLLAEPEPHRSLRDRRVASCTIEARGIDHVD